MQSFFANNKILFCYQERARSARPTPHSHRHAQRSPLAAQRANTASSPRLQSLQMSTGA